MFSLSWRFLNCFCDMFFCCKPNVESLKWLLFLIELFCQIVMKFSVFLSSSPDFYGSVCSNFEFELYLCPDFDSFHVIITAGGNQLTLDLSTCANRKTLISFVNCATSAAYVYFILTASNWHSMNSEHNKLEQRLHDFGVFVRFIWAQYITS